MTRTKHYKYTAVVVGWLFFSLTACTGKSVKKEKPLIAVSVPAQEYFVKAIGGDSVEVFTLASTSTDPETFEPTINQLKTLSKSSAWLTTGVLPFEEKAKVALAHDKQGTAVTNMGKGIEYIYDTHTNCGHEHGDKHQHDHGQMADPHIWSSVVNARILARNTLRALQRVDTLHSAFYEERYERLTERLDTLEASIVGRLQRTADKAFYIWHPSLSYFARDNGLKQIAVGSEGKELSINSLRQRMGASDTAKVAGKRVFFVQQELDPRQAEVLARDLDVKTVTITPLSAQWEQEIEKVVRALE